MILNEMLQWAVLVFLAIFLLGLTRQLGLFLVPRREQLSQYGPAEGRSLPNYLIGGRDREVFRTAIAQSAAGAGLFLVTHQDCEVCGELLTELSVNRRNHELANVPMAVMASGHDEGYISTAAAAGDVLVRDPDGSKRNRSKIAATPFVFVVDADMKILRKEVTANLSDATALAIGRGGTGETVGAGL